MERKVKNATTSLMQYTFIMRGANISASHTPRLNCGAKAGKTILSAREIAISNVFLRLAVRKFESVDVTHHVFTPVHQPTNNHHHTNPSLLICIYQNRFNNAANSDSSVRELKSSLYE